MTPIVHAKELSRWYGIVLGLNNVSFDVYPGITGLVGPNGAGKSTLIQLITGQIQPNSGTLEVFGEAPWNNRSVLKRIGYCPENEAVHASLKPMEWLRAVGMLSGVPKRDLEDRCLWALDIVGLEKAHWSKVMGKYSKGMRQKVKLAQGILNKPDLLILDEPMNGLDPMARNHVANVLKDMSKDGMSVIISSHILPELEALCGNILMLRWGRIIRGDSISGSSESQIEPETLRVRCDQPEILLKILFERRLLQGFEVVGEEDELALELRVSDREQLHRSWNEILSEGGITLYEVKSRSRSLEGTFSQLTA